MEEQLTQRRGFNPSVLGFVVVFVLLPQPAAAQVPPRIRFGAGVSADLLVGDASDFLDSGTGRFLMADVRLDARDRVQLRVDAGTVGLEDDEDERTGARAENTVFTLLAGPQVKGRVGRFHPYGAGLLGLSLVGWQTERPNGDDTTDAEASLAWGAHAGIGYLLDDGSVPVAIQLEARLIDAGEFAFARAPDPTNPDLPVGLVRSDFAAFSLRVAVTLGFF